MVYHGAGVNNKIKQKIYATTYKVYHGAGVNNKIQQKSKRPPTWCTMVQV